MIKTKNPLNFSYIEKWEKDGKIAGFLAKTKDGKEHFTTNTDNDIPIFCKLTELNLTVAAHRTKAQVGYMRKDFLNSRYGIAGNVGQILPMKQQYYLVRNDETLHEFKTR